MTTPNEAITTLSRKVARAWVRRSWVGAVEEVLLLDSVEGSVSDFLSFCNEHLIQWIVPEQLDFMILWD